MSSSSEKVVLAEAVRALRFFIQANQDAASIGGLKDSRDATGEAYQSAWLESLLDKADDVVKVGDVLLAAQSPRPQAEVPEGWVLVPQSALDWLNGEGDDFERPADARGAFWWRTEFKRRCLSAPPAVPGGDGWRDMASAPKDGTKIDLWVHWPATEDREAHSQRLADASWDGVEHDWHDGQFRLGQYLARPEPTHWRPLPHPPAQEGGEP